MHADQTNGRVYFTNAPALWRVTNGASLKEQIWFLWKEKVKILASIALFALVLTPQIVVLENTDGQLVCFFLTEDERFFFDLQK